MSSAWSFLVVEETKRQHRGNEGYDDEVDRHYSWDSTVPNHRRPAKGDLCVLRDSRGVLGYSRVEELTRTAGVTKTRRRCPDCGRTAIKARVKQRPRFRCSVCHAEFERPARERLKVEVYRAEYGRGWVGVDGALTATALEAACLAHSKQQAIRELDPRVLRALLADRDVPVDRVSWSGSRPGDRPIVGGRRPGRNMRRIGQADFRRALLERFGVCCVISGPQPLETLHAAHIYGYAAEPRHELAGGLLLRADLHALFDARQIDVDEQLRVVMHPKLKAFPDVYRYHGVPLRLDSDDPCIPRLRALLAARRESG